MLTAHVNYGLVKRGQDYPIINEGFDWALVKVQGKAFYVFKWVFEKPKNDLTN